MLLIFPPFGTPASPPYSIAYLYTFLKNNGIKTEIIDLNLKYHNLEFKEYKNYIQNPNWNKYQIKTEKFKKKSFENYSLNNKKIINNENPNHFQELINIILKTKKTTVAFSIIYSSQVFYTLALIKELKKYNIKCIIGGPSVNDKLKKNGIYLKNEIELLNYIKPTKDNKLIISQEIDYSKFKNYFIPKIVYPIRLSSTCYYKQCTFCSHHNNKNYIEYNLKDLKKTIEINNIKYLFITDDMIPKNRLLKIAKIIKKYNIKWMCQLRPTKEYDKKTLDILYNSGLQIILWGVESFEQRILNLMKKGTNIEDIKEVLKNSHKAKIKNVTYILFGFPSETKIEMENTINELKNQPIDLISTSVFGLQKNTPIYKNPNNFNLIIKEKKRTLLNPKINYEISIGQNQEEVKKLKKRRKNIIKSINKYPKTMNFFREHMLIFINNLS